MRWRMSARWRIEEVIRRSSGNGVHCGDKNDVGFKLDTLVVDDVRKVWLHDDVAIGSVRHHRHGGPRVGVEVDLLEEFEARLPTKLSSLGSDTIQCYLGKDGSTSVSVGEAGAVELEGGNLTQRILRNVIFLLLDELENHHCLKTSDVGSEGSYSAVADGVDNN